MGQRRPLGLLRLSSPIGKLIQCYRHCKEHGGERFDPITPSCSPSGGGAHANVYRHVCYQDRERFLICCICCSGR
jgi:hypothetical protein